MNEISRNLFYSALLSICFLPFSTTHIYAEDLLEIYQQAVSADPTFRAATFDHVGSRELLKQAYADYLPVVTLDYDKIKTSQDILSSDNPVFNAGSTSFPTTTWSLTVTQPIFRYANYVRVGQAKTELRQADAQKILAQQDLILRAAETYILALGAEDLMTFIKAQQSAVIKQLELARGKEQARTGRLVDRLDAEARMASVEADLADAEVSLRDAYQAVFELTGTTPKRLAALGKNLDLVEPSPSGVSHWVELAEKQNPTLQSQRHAVEIAQQEVSRQNAGHMPTLDLVLRESNRDTGSTLFGGGSNVDTQELMLRLSLPLYQGGSVSSKKRQAIARQYSAMEDLVRLQRQSRRQTQDAYWGVQTAIKRVASLEKAVIAQQETLSLKQASFENGLNTALTVLDAERDLYSARKDFAKARYDYLLNGLRLKAQVGVLVEADLLAINQWLQP